VPPDERRKQELVLDIKSGLSKDELIAEYRLSPEEFARKLGELVAEGVLESWEIEDLADLPKVSVQIRNALTGDVLFSGQAPSTARLVSLAVISGVDLSGAHLPDLNFARQGLRGALLSKADLTGANLSGADLSGANLVGAKLKSADLYGARLRGADLSSADLSDSNLSRADLAWASLAGANLSEANLRNANLYGADLSGAVLFETILDGANMTGANLENSALMGVHMDGANLAWTTGMDEKKE
jgi:uncharacterized protein YjbI with pentapeptide repeats